MCIAMETLIFECMGVMQYKGAMAPLWYDTRGSLYKEYHVVLHCVKINNDEAYNVLGHF